MHFAPDIATRIKQDFPALDVQPVTELLIEFQESTQSGDRILRCLLYVARGRFNYLADAIALARHDFRDLIVSAEYDLDMQRIRDFNQPFDNATMG
jgi:hypothetical protein